MLLNSEHDDVGAGLPVARSRKRVLRFGYAAMIALLLFASFEAYRIQESTSTHHLDLYRRYAQQDEAMAALRYAVWLAGNRVRDFFIDTRPDTAILLKQQLRDLKTDTDQSLALLNRLHATPDPATRAAIEEFWAVIEPVADTMLTASSAQKYAFVEQEIAPRRSVLYGALRDLLVAGQKEIQRRESEIAETRRQSGQRLILVLVLSGVLALAVARFSVVHSDTLERTSEKQYEALAKARQELRQLSGRLVDIEEEGRKRLARELHDEIGQSLAILQIEISNVLATLGDKVPEARARLMRARELAEKTVQSVRGISLLLRPALLDDLGLVPALEWLLEDFMRRSGVRCEFRASTVDDRLPDPVKTCVYRVVQEAIHNCEKHAAASQVRVELIQSDSSITAEVEDDGRGFELDPAIAPSRQSGLGIVGMRERASRLGGTLTIDSVPGRGTRLRLSVPCLQATGLVQSVGARV